MQLFLVELHISTFSGVSVCEYEEFAISIDAARDSAFIHFVYNYGVEAAKHVIIID